MEPHSSDTNDQDLATINQPLCDMDDRGRPIVAMARPRYFAGEIRKEAEAKLHGSVTPISDEENQRRDCAVISVYLLEYYKYNNTVHFDSDGEITDFLLGVLFAEFGISEFIARRMGLETIYHLFNIAFATRRVVRDSPIKIPINNISINFEPYYAWSDAAEVAAINMIIRITQDDTCYYFKPQSQQADRIHASKQTRRPRNQDKSINCVGYYAAAIERGETPPSVGELAKLAGCNKGTASRAIKGWEAIRQAFAREDATERYRRSN